MAPLTLLQFFHWYYPADHSLWNRLRTEIPHLKKKGITGIWLPPASKGASGGYSVGYDAYDLFDLGEFDQKGSIATKYGTRAEYLRAVKACRKAGIDVLADAVFNHKAGADELEKISVRKVDPANRTEFISDAFDIEAWTRFTFPGRKGKYSQFIWDHHCFSGIDLAHDLNESGIFRIQNEYGEGWEEMIEEELGNYDYLMNADIEFRNPAVREEIKYWGKWFLETTGVSGFRLDAVKHISPAFIREWTAYLQSITENHLLFIGEYWNMYSVDPLLRYLEATEDRVQLFDAPLHHNFYLASRLGNKYDLRIIFDNSLLQARPDRAITIVDNHDTQPLQELESPVEAWFKPLAYALILLRRDGIPCIFYPALYGAHYTDKGGDGQDHEIWLSRVDELDILLPIRAELATGDQYDYFDHPNCIGWVRKGDPANPDTGIAVILSNGSEGFKYMELGPAHAGMTYCDALHKDQQLTLDEKGGAEFHCPAGSLGLWIAASVARKF